MQWSIRSILQLLEAMYISLFCLLSVKAEYSLSVLPYILPTHLCTVTVLSILYTKYTLLSRNLNQIIWQFRSSIRFTLQHRPWGPERGVLRQCHALTALPPGKETRYPLYRRQSGPPRAWMGVKTLASSGIQSQTIQPLEIHYTDWAIPANVQK